MYLCNNKRRDMNKKLSEIARKAKSTNAIVLGVCMLLIEVIILTVSFTLNIESNIPLWISLAIMIIGIILIIMQAKREDKY